MAVFHYSQSRFASHISMSVSSRSLFPSSSHPLHPHITYNQALNSMRAYTFRITTVGKSNDRHAQPSVESDILFRMLKFILVSGNPAVSKSLLLRIGRTIVIFCQLLKCQKYRYKSLVFTYTL